MIFAKTLTRADIEEAAQTKEVDFLYTSEGYDYFTIDGKWVRIISDGHYIHGVEY